MSTGGAAVGTKAESRPAVTPMRTLYWSVRRELWEYRSVYIAPIAATVIFLFGFLVSLITLPDRMRAAFALEAAKRHDAILEPYIFAALLVMVAGVVVGVFYSLEALYGERRDRSILFWKSLPVSDLTAVLAKASIPLVVLPLLTTGLTIGLHVMMLLLSSVAMWMGGLSVGPLWQEVAPLHFALMLLYHMVSIHMLWYAPLFAWMLLASAVARRVPLLWAAIPLLAVAVVEKVAFNTTHFVELLQYRLVGGPETLAGSSELPIDPLTHITPATFLGSPGLWAGLAVAGLLLAAAVRVRRSRGPM